jgi:hypothetical protein
MRLYCVAEINFSSISALETSSETNSSASNEKLFLGDDIEGNDDGLTLGCGVEYTRQNMEEIEHNDVTSFGTSVSLSRPIK